MNRRVVVGQTLGSRRDSQRRVQQTRRAQTDARLVVFRQHPSHQQEFVSELFIRVAVPLARGGGDEVREHFAKLSRRSRRTLPRVTRGGRLQHVPHQLGRHEDDPRAEINPHQRGAYVVEKSGGGDVRRVGVAAREREERLTRRQSHGVVSGVVRRRETRHESRGASPELREFLIGQVAFVRLGRLGVVVVGDVVGERRTTPRAAKARTASHARTRTEEGTP